MPEVPLLTYCLQGMLVFVLFILAPVMALGAESQGKRYTLQDVLTLAEEKNPSVAIFQAHLEAARGALTAARAYPNPDFSVDFGRGKPSGNVDAKYEGESRFDVGLPLEWPGKRLSRRKAAAAEIGLSEQASDDFRLALRSQVKEAFFELLFSQRMLDASQKNVGTAEALLSAAQLRVDSGEAPALELIKARVELAREQKERRRAESQVAITKAALNGLLGGALHPEEDITGDFSGTKRDLHLSALIDEAMARHPHILSQKKAIEAAGHRLSFERHSRIPDLTLRGGLSEEIDKRSYFVGLSFTLPLFYQRQGEIAEAQAGAAKAAAELEKSRTELARLITQEYQNYRIALDQLIIFEEGLLKETEEVLQIARLSYRQGESNLLELLDAQRVQRATLIEYFEAQLELESALARLERVTGGVP